MPAPTTNRGRRLTDSPFDTLERTFLLLSDGPKPLALDGRTLAGLPDRLVPVGELKARLLHPATRFEVRDAIVGELVARAQAEGGRWTVALAGVRLPGLRRAVWPLVQACPGRADDIESEALTAFRAGVICAADAELISATRLGGIDLAEAAERLDLGYWACHKSRRRAESALVEWVTGDDYLPFGFVQKRAETPCSYSGVVPGRDGQRTAYRASVDQPRRGGESAHPRPDRPPPRTTPAPDDPRTLAERTD
ncbi:MAG: hypothetical protein M0020_09555 [Actinomycetota bacterium]|nr:hypothetical protein [Actinomycetota bacterium]